MTAALTQTYGPKTEAQRTERRGRVKIMTEKGISAREIAEILRETIPGTTARTVVRDRAVLGISQQRAPLLTETEKERIRALAEDGCPRLEIVRTVGRNIKTIDHAVPGHRWATRRAMSARHMAMAERLRLQVI